MKETKIIYTFPGVGKTTFCRNAPIKIYADMSKPSLSMYDGVKDYIEFLKKYINAYEIVFVDFYKETINELIKLPDKVTLIYPNIKLKDEYMSRYRESRDEEFCDYMNDIWTSQITELQAVGCCNHIILASGSYLSQFLG